MHRIMNTLAGLVLAVVPACGGEEGPNTEGQNRAEYSAIDEPRNGDQPTAQPAGEGAEEAGATCAEPTGEAQDALTQWQKVCTLGCVAFSNGGCAAVGVSCTAGALWSFGGILIPCSYAVVAACVGAGMAGTVCAIKCSGG
jgi:hypothetical protein